MICLTWDDMLPICFWLDNILNRRIFKVFFSLLKIRITVKMNILARIQIYFCVGKCKEMLYPNVML